MRDSATNNVSKSVLCCVLLFPAAAAAFLIQACMRSAGPLVLTLLHMSNCYPGSTNGDSSSADGSHSLEGSGTGLNRFSITCNQLAALPGDTKWPTTGSVYGCDLHGKVGPWNVSHLIEEFCQQFSGNCASIFSDAFAAGTKSSPASRHQSFIGESLASVGMYCEANTSTWTGFALALSIAIITTMGVCAMAACLSALRRNAHAAGDEPADTTTGYGATLTINTL